MVRRLGYNMVTIVLMMMIVMMSTGIVVTQCQHTGRIWVSQSPDDDDADCQPMKGCMMTQLMKLSPTSVSSPAVQHFASSAMVLPAWLFTSLQMVLPSVIPHDGGIVTRRLLHSPPRAYLLMLDVLVI